MKLKRTDEDKARDDALALELLRVRKRTRKDEIKLRAALARRIRDFMKTMTGELLALAIDPHTESKWANLKPTKTVKFEQRGRPPKVLNKNFVIEFIRKEIGASTDPARKLDSYLKAAEMKFGLKRSQVYAIWKAHEDALDRAGRTRAKAWLKELDLIYPPSEK
jgi:hypothetical protein